jgi:hypothetical protein
MTVTVTLTSSESGATTGRRGDLRHAEREVALERGAVDGGPERLLIGD